MSLVMTGNETAIFLIFMIALNGFLCYKLKPIIGVPIGLASFVILFGVQIELTGINVICSLILIIVALGNIFLNIQNYRK